MVLAGMNTAAVLLGGNLGSVAVTFAAARQALHDSGHPIVRASRLYQSPAWGFEAEEPFLNQALLVHTATAPMEFLHFLLHTEETLGRFRASGAGYSSRTIDMDILLWDDRVMNEPSLQVPHPRMHLRRFALAPLAEIAPDMKHPLLDQTIAELLQHCPDTSTVIPVGV
jgi:2-amino-4-hydroxy-6-hydroxymethyldihydropteridine diphosphokinase